jgi:hypothetical protein
MFMDEQTVAAAKRAEFVLGLILGSILGKALAIGTIVSAFGAYMVLCRDRKTELLLALFEKHGSRD